MRRTVVYSTLMIVFLACQSLVGQEGEHHGQGYVFFAPGAIRGYGTSAGTFHFGGGAEGFVYKGLAAGSEIGYLAPWRAGRDGIGLLSLDGSYHLKRDAKVSPFVTGGYSLAFQNGHANAVNFGAGVNWWAGRHTGVRLEFRDHFETQYTEVHYLGFRIGFAFR
jgi:hypothetical protein